MGEVGDFWLSGGHFTSEEEMRGEVGGGGGRTKKVMGRDD